MMAAAAERSGDYALHGKRVWVAGHRGMVGAALVRRSPQEGCEVLVAERGDADLRRQADVERWMAQAGRRRCSSPPPRSAASSPTTRVRPSSSTTT